MNWSLFQIFLPHIRESERCLSQTDMALRDPLVADLSNRCAPGKKFQVATKVSAWIQRNSVQIQHPHARVQPSPVSSAASVGSSAEPAGSTSPVLDQTFTVPAQVRGGRSSSCDCTGVHSRADSRLDSCRSSGYRVLFVAADRTDKSPWQEH